MIVVAIIAVIASLALPSLLQARKTANESSVVQYLRCLQTAQIRYRTR